MSTVWTIFLADNMTFERTFIGKGYLLISISIASIWILYGFFVKLKIKRRKLSFKNIRNLKFFKEVFVNELLPESIIFQVSILYLWFTLHAPPIVQIDVGDALTYLGGLVAMFVLHYNDGNAKDVTKLKVYAAIILVLFLFYENFDTSKPYFIESMDELSLDLYTVLFPLYKCLRYKRAQI